MDEKSLLLVIERMRSDSSYHAAEILRQKLGGADAFANALDTKKDGNIDVHAAARLLITTWESIAVLLRGVRAKDKIYEVTPVCHMYTELLPAIRYFRKQAPEFAVEFEKLSTDYKNWLKKKRKNGTYVSAACGGLLHARFG